MKMNAAPTPLLGRMTTTMRWLGMLPGIPGALLGGWLGEHVGLQAALAFSGSLALLLALAASRLPVLREMRSLPDIDREGSGLVGSLAPTLGAE